METKQFTVGLPSAPPPPLSVKVEEEGFDLRELQFEKPFLIGRDPKCEVILNDKQVSKVHLEVFLEKRQWWVRDMDSTNGTFRDGQKISRVALTGKTKLTLGPLGPLLTFVAAGMEAMEETQPLTDRDVTSFVEHLISEKPAEKSGTRTQMLRRALQVVQKKQSKKYVYVIGAVSVLAIGAAVFAYIKHTQLVKQQELAKAVFYELKELELAQAALERRLAAVGDSTLRKEGAS